MDWTTQHGDNTDMDQKISLFDDWTILNFDSLESTNDYLKQNDAPKIDKLVVDTKIQTKGRGRRGRTWISQEGDDLTFSLLMNLGELPNDHWSLSSLVAGLALSDFLNSQNITHHIKWPNDIEAEGRKLCGILCETTKKDDKFFVIIGIGMNVNSQAKLYQTIEPGAISLAEINTKQWNTENILHGFLEYFDARWQELHHQGPVAICKTISNRLLGKGKQIEWQLSPESPAKLITLDGISESGLLLAHDENESFEIQSGEITWRHLF